MMFLLALTWSLVAMETAAQAPAKGVDALQWLSGCWTLSSEGRVVEEHWMRPAGGTMLGMGRTVRGGRTTEYEFLQIREAEGRLTYEARPSGQDGASFPLSKLGPSEVVFENPSHDFPQRIIYRRNTDGSVTGRIEGTTNGKLQAIDFPYARCP